MEKDQGEGKDRAWIPQVPLPVHTSLPVMVLEHAPAEFELMFS